MKFLTLGVLALLLPATLHAEPRRADPAVLAGITDDYAFSLPRGLAPGEINLPPAAVPDLPFAPPTGTVRAEAEFEANEGIVVRWGTFNSLLTEMTVPLTTATPPSTVYVVVSSTSQQNSASSTLQSAGADIAHVRFVIAPTDSVWMRDYGPRFIIDSGRRAIVDHTYNRPRPNDNLIPIAFGNYLGEPVYAMPLIHGGGNFHLFADRDAYMTRLIVNENPGLTEQQIQDTYLDYQGLDLTLTDPFPQSFDSTQHIDMWMLPMANGKVLISEYDASESGGIPKAVSDSTAQLMAGRGYTVFRTPGWSSGGTHYTYANSVIVNDVVLICRFSGQTARNAQARATYEAAMPGYDVIDVDCSSIIQSAGAIHCIVMHVPDLLYRSEFDTQS
ncbi:agmatine deiminase family protein [Dokdonella sp.]|uniref:agmatine deiminase family protein n=1 Tax=Dokdonella sp. TaxID=2291710 RepID=UPI00352871C7